MKTTRDEIISIKKSYQNIKLNQIIKKLDKSVNIKNLNKQLEKYRN